MAIAVVPRDNSKMDNAMSMLGLMHKTSMQKREHDHEVKLNKMLDPQRQAMRDLYKTKAEREAQIKEWEEKVGMPIQAYVAEQNKKATDINNIIRTANALTEWGSNNQKANPEGAKQALATGNSMMAQIMTGKPATQSQTEFFLGSNQADSNIELLDEYFKGLKTFASTDKSGMEDEDFSRAGNIIDWVKGMNNPVYGTPASESSMALAKYAATNPRGLEALDKVIVDPDEDFKIYNPFSWSNESVSALDLLDMRKVTIEELAQNPTIYSELMAIAEKQGSGGASLKAALRLAVAGRNIAPSKNVPQSPFQEQKPTQTPVDQAMLELDKELGLDDLDFTY